MIDLDLSELTNEILRQLRVTCWQTGGAALLPFVRISPRELQMMDEAVGMNINHRELRIGIGTGITYTAAHNGKRGGYVEVAYHRLSDCFELPIAVTICTSHAPEAAAEHNENCPYSRVVWPTDERGESYWVYDGADDDFSNRHYDVDCECDYIDDETREIVINEGDDLALVTEIVAEMWGKL